MAADELPAFAVLLGRYRAAAGLTQEELAAGAGLSVEAIGALERGTRTRPRAVTVAQLAAALGLSPDDRALLERSARAAAAVAREDPTLPQGNYLGALPPYALVAREEERERILAVLEAVTGGAGHLLLLGGEAGVGKTRLAQELLIEARERGYLARTGRCSAAEQATPYLPILEALSGLAPAAPGSIRAEVQRRWVKVQRLVGGGSPEGAGPAGGALEQQELAGAVAEQLLLVAKTVPLALVLDDLHWADPHSLRLLRQLARSLRTARILLVGTFRDTRLGEEHPDLAEFLQTLTRDRVAERLGVRRFSPEETAALVGAIMGQQQVSEEFAAFVQRRTKGNPRLIDQLVRSLGGRLELQGEIGAGAMGRVFRALDRATGTTVAAKLVLARAEIDLDSLLRFQHEGAVLATLSHPNIVHVHDTFAEEHASCIVMELLDGPSLGQLLRDGPLSLPRAKRLALQVAEALTYAHGQGIVHRDIKPDNVMVVGEDRVKVTDFGIARLLRPDTSLQTIATTGLRLGTPLYMAPEQIEGKQVDGRTDIYAFGALLFHMVTGRPPFEGGDALAVAVQQLQEEPVPPSRINPAIPADWDALIRKAMAKDPTRRFQSAQALGEALAALGERATSRTATVRRDRRLAAVAGVLAVAAAIVGGLWAHASRGAQHPGPASSAQRPGPIAGIDAYLAQHYFSGYVLLERGGRVLLSKGYGLANTQTKRLNSLRSTWLDVGVYRFITAVAILRLQDRHKLSVHDKLCRYTKDCPAGWRRITIDELLLDTSGLGSFSTTDAPGGVAQTLARCKALPVGEPGAITPESRCSTLLLNSIIVTVSGQPWAAAMHDLVFGPAHMVDSGQLTNASIPPGWVQGYSAGAPVPLGNVDNYYLPYSSLQDLERLDRALLSGHLLSPEALHALFTPHINGGAVLNRYFAANGSHAPQLAGGYEDYLRNATPATVLVADKPGIMGGISLDNALSPEDGTIAIMAKNVDSGPDPTDLLFGLASHLLWGKPASRPPPAPPPGNPIAAYLTRARFNGYIYLERHGQVLLNRGFGMADAEDKVPNTAQTRWPAFAATRFLVALAIMKLQEQGKLSIRQAICTYIRGCPAAWRPLTVEELLLNTSGMGSYDPFAPGVSLDQTMAACKTSPLVSPPGSTSLWSDCNTFVLGAILEKVTGKTWAAAMQDLVYGPAGMANTGRMTNALRPPQRGRLYRAGVATPELNYDGYNLAYTTVDDLIRLGHALLAGTLVSRQSLDAMFTPRVPADPSDPHAVWFGYEVVMWPAMATTYQPACAACVIGGGEDDTGAHSGFFMTVWVSPEADSLQIEVVNDTGYFNPGDDDNALFSFVSKALYGK